MQRPPMSENKEPPVDESETPKFVGLHTEVAQLKAELAAGRRKFRQQEARLEADAKAAEEEY